MKKLFQYRYLVVLLMAMVALEAKQSPKIVGLLQVRNEEIYIEQCLRALSYYTDAIVVLDDGSQDSTVRIVQFLAQELHIERIIRNEKSAWQAHDERYNRQRLLEEGRAIKGTHFIFIDTDEMFSAECAKNDWLRKQILAMEKGQMLRMPELNLWGSTQYYRDDDLYSPVTTHWARKPFAFCDDEQSNYHKNKSWCLSGIIHISVEPANRKVARHVPHTIYLTDINRCALHFKFVNLDNVAKK